MLGAVSTSRTYALAGNRMTGFNQAIGAASTSAAYTYNANGDLINDGLRGYAHDAEGRLATTTTGATDTSPTTRYAHNALGQRVFKTEPQYPVAKSSATVLQSFFTKPWSPATTPADVLGFGYVYDEQGSLIGEYGAGGAKSVGSKQYLYLPTAAGPMPVSVVFNSDKAYSIVADHLNTPRRITAPDATLVWQWGYSAFGDEAPTVAARKFASVPAVDGDLEFNLRYPGQYFDKESNLHYNGFRTYNPTTGRYTQGDPIGLQGGWNRFGYVGGNPLGFADPSGLDAMVITGGISNGSPPNPFGHVGVAVTGYGMASYGNNTQLGSSASAYLTSQDSKRNQQVTIIPTTPAQDAAMIAFINQHPDKNGVGYFDNCAVRTNQILNVGGIQTQSIPVPGGLARDVANLPNTKTYSIPQGAKIPDSLQSTLQGYKPQLR